MGASRRALARARSWLRGSIVVAVAVVAASTPAPSRSPASAWPLCGTWRAVTTPSTAGFPKELAVVSPTEAWFVGKTGGFYGDPVVHHWTGQRWVRVRFPRPPGDPYDVEIRALDVISADEVWAVGFRTVERSRPIAARWDGARWSLVPIRIEGLRGSLNGVSHVPGTHDVIAVGTTSTSGWGVPAGRPIVLRYHGGDWRRVRLSTPGDGAVLDDVIAFRDVAWAVGSFRDDEKDRTLAVRLGARDVRLFRGPRGGLTAVDGLRPDALWAVGPGKDLEPQHGLVMRWGGERWSVSRRYGGRSALQDVVVVSPGKAWAVGYRRRFPHEPFVIHRDRAPWRITRAPDVDGRFWEIDGTPNNLWTLRWYVVGDSGFLDTFHRC